MSSSTIDIATTLQTVRKSIASMAEKHGRNPASIQLLAVSKTKPVVQIAQAMSAGQRAFGENYPDEALEKINELGHSPDGHSPDGQSPDGQSSCEWHFIGAIQSRKAAGIARSFHWVHSVERLKVARKLSENRPIDMPPIHYCLQVNIDNEASKSGVLPEQVLDLAAQCSELPQLKLRGLMAIPRPETDFDRQRDAFARVRQLQETLRKTYPDVDTLSMGMSGDLEAAIAEGATIVRVGTAIFGARAT